jgi:tRNA(Ile)-lysidine synthase
MDLRELVLRTIKRYGMLSKGDRVVVGISGGPDSTALLLILCELAEDFDLFIHAAHLNHMIRGEEADRDEDFVRDLCGRMGIGITCKRVDVLQLKRSLGISEEDAGRRARYEFLSSVAEDIGANRIALGHTADDQAETVLMRILRGCGIEGLKGIPPVRGMIIRPLIEVSASEIRGYLEGKGVTPRIDSTNLIPKYLRNRIRNELFPILLSYNPRIKSSLARLAELAMEEDEYMRSLAIQILDGISSKGNGIAIDRSALEGIAIPLRRRVIREAIRRVKGDLRRVDYQHIQLLLDPPSLPFSLDLPDGIKAELSEKDLKIRRVREAEPPPPPVDLFPPGFFELPEWGCAIRMDIVDRGEISEEEMRSGGKTKAFMDLDKLSLPLLLRAREKGDRIRPFGMKGTKKVKEIMIEEKIPRDKRDRWPIICSGGKVAWVVGKRSSEDFKVTDETRRVLVVEVFYPYSELNELQKE